VTSNMHMDGMIDFSRF